MCDTFISVCIIFPAQDNLNFIQKKLTFIHEKKTFPSYRHQLIDLQCNMLPVTREINTSPFHQLPSANRRHLMGICNAVRVLVGSLYTPHDMAINIENT